MNCQGASHVVPQHLFIRHLSAREGSGMVYVGSWVHNTQHNVLGRLEI